MLPNKVEESFDLESIDRSTSFPLFEHSSQRFHCGESILIHSSHRRDEDDRRPTRIHDDSVSRVQWFESRRRRSRFCEVLHEATKITPFNRCACAVKFHFFFAGIEASLLYLHFIYPSIRLRLTFSLWESKTRRNSRFFAKKPILKRRRQSCVDEKTI